MTTHELRILLVEDDPMLQFVFEKQMARLGIKLTAVADNGLSAVEKALEERFHLVFMDVRLPIFDGLIATERIRKLEGQQGVHTPIVGLTAFAERQRCLEAGMDDFLQKPVTMDDLQDIISKWTTERTKVSGTEAAAERIAGLGLEHTAIYDPDKFSKTDEKLKAIQSKLSKLRKRLGLD